MIFFNFWAITTSWTFAKTSVKALNSGHLWVFKKLSVIKRCLLLGGSSKEIATFGTNHFVRYSWQVRYLGCPILESFTVWIDLISLESHSQAKYYNGNYFGKKKLIELKMKTEDFLCKLGANSTFWSQKHQSFALMITIICTLWGHADADFQNKWKQRDI